MSTINRARDVVSRRNATSRALKNAENRVAELENDLEDARKLEMKAGAISRTLRSLTVSISREESEFLVELINFGLKSVFTDRSYYLELEFESGAKSSRADLEIVSIIPGKDGKSKKVSDSIDDVGGGLKTLVAFLFRIFLIVRTQKSRVVVIDEGFSFISGEYSDMFKDLLQQLQDKMGFVFLNVSHDPRFEFENGTVINILDHT